MAADTSRPTVVLADDDAGILAAISRTVAPDFQVVGTVTDGHQALDAVRRLDPDVAVLDISMPGLNGFETAAALKRSGARARTVFLTAHDDDHFVARAISSGAMGYVPKTLAWSNLVPALRSALAGRQHLPSLTPLVITNADAHAVLFHENDSSWLERVSDVLSRALHRGDIVATALTRSNHDVLASCMNERGWNLTDLRTHHRYLVVDAEDAATRIMQAGRVHPESIAEMVATLERARTTSAAGPRSHLTIVGEIAVVLCRRGNPEAALDLERLWDELTRSLPILTICAYPTDCCDPDPTAMFLEGISAHHSVISHAVRA
jgi:DNA-binding NarL/FixJ family response regulator